VWYHVHVVTDFRTNGEWKEIIHLIRLTAFELGILLNEKLSDMAIISDGDFDVNSDASEFLTSVLLTRPTRPQDAGSVNDHADACVHSSVETTDDFDGHHSGNAHLDSSAASASLVDGFSSNASPSAFVLSPETPTTDFNQLTPTSYLRIERVRDDTPTPQSRAMADSTLADCHITPDSGRNSEPLVTSHGKVCLWCEIEGAEPHDGTPTEEANVNVGENRETFNQRINELSEPANPPDIQLAGSLDASIEGLNDLRQFWELPGPCGVDNLPHLLYRWSNTNSQGINSETLFVAGWFTGTYPDVGSPGQMSETDFLSVFAAHVTRVQVPTPFISAFARPLAPIHRAVRNRQNAKVSIIDPRKLATPVFYAKPLAQITRTTVKRWKGYGEYAIWGYAPSEAIICTFDIAALEDIVSWDHEIQNFLQLHLFNGQVTCHRALRRDLCTNLRECSYKTSRCRLRRLAFYLGLPEEYNEYFAKDIHDAWTMDFGPAYEGREKLQEPGTLPARNVSDEVDDLNRVMRCNSESTTSYIPPRSDDGSCSESTSEEEDNLSQSPEAPCPRRDTLSPAFSVVSDSDDSVHVNMHRSRPRVVMMAEVAIPPTQPSTSRYFGRVGNINSVVPPLNLNLLNLSSSLNDDQYLSEGAEWPSDDGTLPGIDTPTQSRFFEQRDNDGASGRPAVSRFTIQGRNPLVLSDDDMVEL
jgi:hypothetical protein